MSAMKAATYPSAAGLPPPRRRRAAPPPPRDFKDLSPFEQIVAVCCAPAGHIMHHLEEMEPYQHTGIDDLIELDMFLLAVAEAAVGLCVATVVWCLLKGVALALRRIQRPKYYPQERLRRQALARERRRIRCRTTLNAAPTADELLAQWAKVRKSPEEMLRFGSMLCDLEAYVDNSLVRNEYGEIVGRNPGIRGWLNANCQPLAAHYKTVMGYKALAEKFRQAVGLADPYPATLALGAPADTVPEAAGGEAAGGRQNTVRKSDDGEADGGLGDTGVHPRPGPRTMEAGGRQNTVRKAEERTVRRRARRKAEEMLGACGRSQRGVRIALAARLAPDQVPPEVEQEERRRQGLPARDGPLRRFVQRMA